MNKTGRVLSILDLFSDTRRHIGAADVAALLGISVATAYRYINELKSAGFLVADGAGWFVLGPAIVRLDRLVREHDPLVTAARDLLRQLSDLSGGTVLLARHVADAVMCIDQRIGRHGPLSVSYERGRAMPLYRGSPSIAILAQLSPARLDDIVRTDADALRAAGLPVELNALQRYLADIGQQGVVHTHSAVDPGVMGWSVAISNEAGVLGSLSVLLADTTSDIQPSLVSEALRRAGLRIQARLD